jgi:hypothetical protein
MDYARHYRALIERARNRHLNGCYVERHHIIPRCMGGDEEPSNLVRLTAEEHCLAHQLLAKMHPENEKLAYAAKTMGARAAHLTGSKNKRYGKAARAGARGWGAKRRRNAIRARKRKAKRYTKADVARMARILASV